MCETSKPSDNSGDEMTPNETLTKTSISVADASNKIEEAVAETFQDVEEPPLEEISKSGFGRPLAKYRGSSLTARLNLLDDDIILMVRYVPMAVSELARRVGVSETTIRHRLQASKGQNGLGGTDRFQLVDKQVTISQGGIDRHAEDDYTWRM